MKITNLKNLPLPVVEALKKMRAEYDKGESDYTATSLLKPSRAVELERLHWDDLSEDAFNLIPSAHGTAIHSMFEAAGKELEALGYIAEKRFYITVDGKKIGAKIDLFDTNTGTLYDYKTSSVTSLRYGLKEEHAQQLNIGAECLRQAGYDVKAVKVAAFPVDWRAWEAKDNAKYPPRYSEKDVPIISPEEVIEFIRSRISSHEGAKEKLPKCTAGETWNKRRCFDGWCAAASVCEQFKGMKK